MHIRKVICPVVYTDFLCYIFSTVNALMGLWQFVIAREIRVVAHCKDRVEAFLRKLTPDMLFDPQVWSRMTGFVKVIPNGDVLPIRSKYGVASNDWQVGLNHAYAKKEDALWYSIPMLSPPSLRRVLCRKLLMPFLIEPDGVAPGLTPTKLRGIVEVHPERDDFFRVIVEERLRLAHLADLSDSENKRLEKALNNSLSATCFGIYAQMDRQGDDDKVEVTCHGIDSDPYRCKVAHPEFPGEFCFPPLASLITAGARLMLALLEHCVSELHGSYALEDTDSFALWPRSMADWFLVPVVHLRWQTGALLSVRCHGRRLTRL